MKKPEAAILHFVGGYLLGGAGSLTLTKALEEVGCWLLAEANQDGTTEQKIDAKLAQLGIRPHIYHFKDVEPFRAITLALPERNEQQDLENIVKFGIDDIAKEPIERATLMRAYLRRHEIYGVAICDQRDTFSQKLGETIAKGRLWKHLDTTRREK
jgi:hypothetical protein